MKEPNAQTIKLIYREFIFGRGSGLRAVCLLIAIIFFSGKVSSQKNPRLLSDGEIKKILVDRIDKMHKSPGIVVGIISPEGRRTISYGKIDNNDSRPVNGETVFEIGPATQIITSLILSEMAMRGQLELNDPLDKFFPPFVKIPSYKDRTITLTDLSTHTSGFPFWPPGVPQTNEGAKSMSKYSMGELYQYLTHCKLTRDPGSQWEYSNLGAGILGIALGNRIGLDYETLLREKITDPLGMKNTGITLTESMKNNIGRGHDANLKGTDDWNIPIFPGAASIKSTADDMLTLLGAFLGYTHSPLKSAMDAMFRVHRPGPDFTQALGWSIIQSAPGDSGIAVSGGETIGYSSSIAVDLKNGIGIVVLSNSAEGEKDLACKILRSTSNFEISETGNSIRKEIAIEPGQFKRYVGNYEIKPGLIVSIEESDKRLVLKSPATPAEGVVLHAADSLNFFVKEFDMSLIFKIGKSGRAENMLIRLTGSDTPAHRIE
jgi:serine-type D-Ala-D-Ala carboxypeptidase/endopeptidase